LPLAMAFVIAIASGVAPEAGIFTAIIAGFLTSSLGGSRVHSSLSSTASSSNTGSPTC
jgi:SulP family sulfate permease